MGIEGLKYLSSFITEPEEQYLLTKIDDCNWQKLLTRKIQQFGYTYSFFRHKIDSTIAYKTIPEWIHPISNRINEMKMISEIPDQLVINEYMPGQGIAAHIDSEICFSSYIIIVSLLSGCEMEFVNKRDAENIEKLYLEPRSLLLISGKSRYNWMHGISESVYDIINGRNINRERRISISFRKTINT